MRALAGKSSARGHCDKNRTVAQRPEFSLSSHVERSTDSNDVIYPGFESDRYGEVMHWSCDDHEVRALQFLDQFFGPGHRTFGKQFRERSLRSTESSCIAFIEVGDGAADRSNDDRCRGLGYPASGRGFFGITCNSPRPARGGCKSNAVFSSSAFQSLLCEP